MLGERKREFELWLKGLIALYKLDVDPSVERHLRKREELEEVREQLFFHNLVSKGKRGKLEITQQGRRAIGRLMQEQDDLIAKYDIYRDVVSRRDDDGTERYEFASLSGIDYRVPVYRHLGEDPFRAVFLLTLLAGELDEELEGKKWIDVIGDEHYYEAILKPAIEAAPLTEEEAEDLVKQGEQYLSRTAALRDRARYSEEVLARAGTIEAFPRGGAAGAGAPRHLPSRPTPDEEDDAEEPPKLPAATVTRIGQRPGPRGAKPGKGPGNASGPAGPKSGEETKGPRGPGGPGKGNVSVTVSRGGGGPRRPFRRRPFKRAKERQSQVPAAPPFKSSTPEGERPSSPPPPKEPALEPKAPADEFEAEAMREVEEMLAADNRNRDLSEAEEELEKELAEAAKKKAAARKKRGGDDPDADDGWL